jgi:hypothetical protein
MTERHPLLSKLVAGGGASILSKTCVAPFERTKLLLQTSASPSSSNSPVRIISTVVKHQGVLALWRGNFANCVRVFPSYALRFAFFDFYQKLVSSGSSPDAPLPAWRQLVSGGLSGATTLTLTYPLDLLRTRLATNSSTGVRPSLIATASNTLKSEGVLGLYRGYVISVIEITPYLALSMGGYNWLKDKSENSDQKGSPWNNLLYGWMSGTTASLVCYPMDTIKRRMMLLGSVDHGSWAASVSGGNIRATISDVLAGRGVRGLYAGCMVNALNSGPAAAITFAANDFLRDRLL